VFPLVLKKLDISFVEPVKSVSKSLEAQSNCSRSHNKVVCEISAEDLGINFHGSFPY
jgi:hypothetical protein